MSGVGIVDHIRGSHHTPVLGVVDIMLVVSATHLDILDLRHVVVVVREGDVHFTLVRNARDGQRVVPLFRRTDHIEVNLDIVLGLGTLVFHKCTHQTTHAVFGRILTSGINLGNGNVVRIEVSHADTVHIEVVTALRDSVKSDISAA